MRPYGMTTPERYPPPEKYRDYSWSCFWEDDMTLRFDVSDITVLAHNSDAREVGDNIARELERAQRESELLHRIFRAVPYLERFEGASSGYGRGMYIKTEASTAAGVADAIVKWLAESLLAGIGARRLYEAEARMAGAEAAARWDYIWGPVKQQARIDPSTLPNRQGKPEVQDYDIFEAELRKKLIAKGWPDIGSVRGKYGKSGTQTGGFLDLRGEPKPDWGFADSGNSALQALFEEVTGLAAR